MSTAVPHVDNPPTLRPRVVKREEDTGPAMVSTPPDSRYFFLSLSLSLSKNHLYTPILTPQRPIHPHPRRRPPLSTHHLPRKTPSPCPNAPLLLHRLRPPRLLPRPQKRLSQFPRLLQSLLDRPVHYGRHHRHEEYKGYRVRVAHDAVECLDGECVVVGPE